MLFVGALLVGGTVDAVRITVDDAKHAIDTAWTYYLNLVDGYFQPNNIYNLVFPVHLGGIYGAHVIQGSCNWDNNNKLIYELWDT